MTVSPSDQTLFLHENFSVSCAFNGTPEPSVVWRKDDDIIASDDLRYKMSSCATSSVLEIHDVQYTDQGEYNCTVTNPLGDDFIVMELLIEGMTFYYYTVIIILYRSTISSIKTCCF